MRHFFKLTILFIFVFATRGSAQKLSYGLELDPSYHLRKDGEFNFAGGGFVALEVSDRFVLSTGVKIGWQHLSDKIDVNFDYYIDPVTGAGFSNSYFELANNATYIGIPLQARYKLSDKDNHFYVNLNLTYWERASTNSFESFVKGGITLNQRSVKTIYNITGFSTALGFGYEFTLKGRFSIYLEPKFSLSHYLKDGDIEPYKGFVSYDSRQTELGLSVGMRFK